MEKTIVIAHIVQFASIAKQYPAMMSIPSFITIREIFNKLLAPNVKGCSKCRMKSLLSQYRPQFEAAMSILTPNEQAQLKKIVAADKICYTRKMPNGQLKNICF